MNYYNYQVSNTNDNYKKVHFENSEITLPKINPAQNSPLQNYSHASIAQQYFQDTIFLTPNDMIKKQHNRSFQTNNYNSKYNSPLPSIPAKNISTIDHYHTKRNMDNLKEYDIKEEKIRSKSTYNRKAQRLDPIGNYSYTHKDARNQNLRDAVENKINNRRVGADIFYNFKMKALNSPYEPLQSDITAMLTGPPLMEKKLLAIENKPTKMSNMLLNINEDKDHKRFKTIEPINQNSYNNDELIKQIKAKKALKKNKPNNEDATFNLNDLSKGIDVELDTRNPKIFQALFLQDNGSKSNKGWLQLYGGLNSQNVKDY